MNIYQISKKASRGDQIENARIFEKQGFAEVILEDNLTQDSLLNSIHTVFNNRQHYVNKMANRDSDRALVKIFDLINTYTNQ